MDLPAYSFGRSTLRLSSGRNFFLSTENVNLGTSNASMILNTFSRLSPDSCSLHSYNYFSKFKAGSIEIQFYLNFLIFHLIVHTCYNF